MAAELSYQSRVEKWLETCISLSAISGRSERIHRFPEEALELAQANDGSRDDARALVNYVSGRASGRPEPEIGGVMVALAGLCSAPDINMSKAGKRERERNWDRIDLIQAKQLSQPHGSPLPQ